MKFIETLERLLSTGQIEKFLVECNTISDCLEIKDDVIHLTSRYKLHNKRISRGVVSYENELLNENKILEAALCLKNIVLENEEKLKECAPKHTNEWIPRMNSLTELLPIVVESIQIENQDILSNYFTGQEDVQEVMVKMTGLFHRQSNRRNFSEWTTMLNSSLEYFEYDESGIFNEIQSLVKIIADYKTTLYSYPPVDISPRRIDDFMSQVVRGIIGKGDVNKFHMTILHKFPPDKAKFIISNYLNYLRETTDEVTMICNKIRSRL